MACRDIARAETARKEILDASENKSVEVMRLDLTDLDSVRSFAKEFLAKYKTLDLLINNAGVAYVMEYKLTKNKLETQMASNHYGHFLLTNLLLPTLKATPHSRVINVASRAHLRATWDVNNLNGEKGYNPFTVYALTKLANLYFTSELSSKLLGTQVKTVSLHPGVVYTDIGRNLLNSKWKMALALPLYPLIRLLMKNELQGAQTTLHCALCDWRDLESGQYYADCKVARMSELAQNRENARLFWETSAKLVGLSN